MFYRLFILCLVSLCLDACAPGTAGPLRLAPISPRVDAVAGHTFILPVEASGPVGAAPLEARLDDGRRLEAGLFWISVGPEPEADSRSWLVPAGRWSATPAGAPTRPFPSGVWAAAIEVPPDALGPIWLNGQRVNVNWAPDATGRDAPAGNPREGATVSARLAELLAPERNSPARRWRWRLATGGLDGQAPEPADTFQDPTLEALAAQDELLWAAALFRLAQDDSALESELARRLAALVDIAGTIAPAWSARGIDVDNLRNDLLSPALSGPARVERTRAWLASQPVAVAWVADDAGRIDDAGVTSAAVGIANLSASAALCGLSTDPGLVPSDLVPLEPHHAAVFTLPVAPARDRAGNIVSVSAVAGGWSETLPVMAVPIPARPPGLTIGPLFPDWTLETWLAGRAAAVGAPGAALLLMRDPGGSWSLFIESPRGSGSAEDTVRVWLGPAGSPVAILRAASDGLVVDEAAPSATASPPVRTPVSAGPDGRWSCRLPIPARCIGKDGTLRVGVERVDSDGRRWAWPRPMLPWQTEPGRLAVDTTAWGSLEAPPGGQ